MKYRIFIFLILLPFVMKSCLDNDQEDELIVDPLETVCGVENPVEELDWLAEEIEELESTETGRSFFYINTGEYEDEQIFLFRNCCPFCNSIITVYECDGTQRTEEEVDLNKVTDEELFWAHPMNECT